MSVCVHFGICLLFSVYLCVLDYVCLSVCLAASSGSDQIIAQYVSQHGKTWPYWFRKMGQCQLCQISLHFSTL